MITKSLQKILKPARVIMSESHIYTAENGDLYTGCTTISDAWRKDFLSFWYAKETINALLEKLGDLSLLLMDNARPKETPAVLELLDWCKKAAPRKADQAKQDGTDAHDYIEKVLAIKISGKGKKPELPKSKEAQNAINAFIEWAKKNKVQWLASEEILANHEHKVAGTLDAIAVIDGITYLVDFKTSSQISESYLLQCAGYDLMLREMGLQVMGLMILRLPKDGKEAETLTITNQEDMKFFRETFLRMREAYKFFLLMNSKFKDAQTKRMKVDMVEVPILGVIESKTGKIKVKKIIRKKK